MVLLKKTIILAVVVIFAAVSITGCELFKNESIEDEPMDVPTNITQLEEEGIRETLIYYQDDVGYLVPVMRKIPWEEGIAKAVLKKMMDTPEQQSELMMMGLRALLPENAEILGLSIDDGLAKLDFNEEVMETSDAVSESNMIQGVVLTLTEFPAIDEVQFLFNGEVVDKLKFGTDVSRPLTQQETNIEMSDNASLDGTKLTVFYHSTSVSDFEYLVPVTRIISQSLATIETAIEELISGPKDFQNLKFDIPQGTKLIGVQMEEGVTYINFSKEFDSLYQSPESEEMVFKAITMTARQFPEVNEVVILVEGNEYEGLDRLEMPTFANEY